MATTAIASHARIGCSYVLYRRFATKCGERFRLQDTDRKAIDAVIVTRGKGKVVFVGQHHYRIDGFLPL